ncbi:alpha/beta hydrolase [Amycolatopsis sp. K13G38]|uniref:Alpha/beta hydrolase n=1 Tax=Amycolatopsis acididurans TaxID=2724524 RepID=A0ABX1JGH0_9PSEU|nr:alpha/beta hydrolase [Amycolatopsis acididurans]NKQ58833.1 alpha/beta hydrolase [Amycolatopsis acididurans]
MFATADDGTKIYYEVVPGERPVLLVHGFASDGRRNWADTGWLRALDGRGVVTVDLRGHGQSDEPGTGYSPETLTDDVTAALDAAGMSTVDVVTYSMGGLIGWELTRRGRVRRLVLGGIDGRPVSERDIEPMGGPAACAEGIAGHGIEGTATVPVLVVAGEADDIAAEAGSFAARIGAEFVPILKRNHFNAVSSRAFKQAAVEFLENR